MAAKTLFEGGATGKLFLDRREFYPDPQSVAELWSDLFPFTTVLENLETKKVDDALYKMFENESSFYKQEFTVSTALTIAANGTESNALTVANIVGLPSTVTDYYEGLVCEIWDSTKTTKRGVVVISDAASSSTIKCKTLKASAITTVSGDYFLVIGKIRGEGHVAPVGFQKELSVVWNSTMLNSESCEITGDMYAAAKLKGYSDEMSFQRQEMFKRYKNYMEQGLMKSVSTVGSNFNGSDTFSEASLRTLTDSTSTSGSLRTTYGYIPILEDYGTTYTGAGNLDPDTNIFKIANPTYNDFIKYAEIIFDKRDMDEALCFSGRGAITTIAQKVADGDKKFGWAGKMQLGDAEWNKIGFNMRALETNHGVFWLVPTKSLRNAYNQHMLIPNLDHIGVATFRPDEYKNNVKTNDDYDGVKDSIKSSKGIWMRLLKSHHMIQFQ